MQGKTLDKAPFSWTTIQKLLASPSQTLSFLKEFPLLAQQGQFHNIDSLSLAKKSLLSKGSILQNSENSLILETMKKLAGFTVLGLKYIELFINEKESSAHKDFTEKINRDSVNQNMKEIQKDSYSRENLHNNKKEIQYDSYSREDLHSNKKDIQKDSYFSENLHYNYDNDNEFLEEEQPSVLKVSPSQQQYFIPPPDKTPPRSPKLYTKEKTNRTPLKNATNSQAIKPRIIKRIFEAKPLIYEETITPSKRSFLIKKESKFERIMKIKIKKPKVVSQIKLYLQSQGCSPMKYSVHRPKSVDFMNNSVNNSRRDNSEPIGERLIKKDMEHLKREMKKLDSQKTKLTSAFTKELKKVEAYKTLKEKEEDRKKELEIEKRFLQRKGFEEKQEKIALKDKKINEVLNQRIYQKQMKEQKKLKEKEEIETYVLKIYEFLL